MNGCIVTGIDTEVGKTVASAILTLALEAEYWKPIQIGEQSDREWIETLHIPTHPEACHLPSPISSQRLPSLILPQTEKFLVIEGCGGVLCPLGKWATLLNTFKAWNFPWIVVSRPYLGSLNHTQLTIEKLKQEKQTIWGILFNGNEHPKEEKWLTSKLNVPLLGRIQYEPTLNRSTLQWHATQLRPQLLETSMQFGTPLCSA